MHGSHGTAYGSQVARTPVRETHANQPLQAGVVRESPAASTRDTPLFDSPSGGSEPAMAPTVGGDRQLWDAPESTGGTVRSMEDR
jgi:hypothetical protein